jgi:hypothetical protein
MMVVGRRHIIDERPLPRIHADIPPRPLTLPWLSGGFGRAYPAFALVVPSGSPPKCYAENPGIPGKISWARGIIRPEASPSVLYRESIAFCTSGEGQIGLREAGADSSRFFPRLNCIAPQVFAGGAFVQFSTIR